MFGVDLTSLAAEEAEAFRLLLRYKRARQSAQDVRKAHRSFVDDGTLVLANFSSRETANAENNEDEAPIPVSAAQGRQPGQQATTRTGAREVERIAGLRSLSRLVLGEVEPTAIPKLAQLPIQHLGFRLEEDADLAPLAKMETLQSLMLSGGGITRLSALRDCTNLRSLSITLADNYAEIDCIGAGSPLTRLTVHASGVSSLAPVAIAKSLEELGFYGNRLEDAEVIERLTRLQVLALALVEWDGAPNWAALHALTSVELNHAPLEVVAALHQAPSLTSVRIFWYPSDALDPLPEHLTELELWPIGDKLNLTAIKRFRSLASFDANMCALENADALLTLSALENVWFYECTGFDATLVEALRAKGVTVQVS